MMPNVVTHACKRFTGDAKIYADVSSQIESSERILTIFVCRGISGSYLSTKVNANLSISVVVTRGRSYVTNVHIMEDVSFQRPGGKLIKN